MSRVGRHHVVRHNLEGFSLSLSSFYAKRNLLHKIIKPEDVANGVFNDFELIESLGCKSVVNVPIVVGDNLLGTVNCLHRENYYTADRVEKFDNIKLAAITCFLLHLLGNNSGEPI